ncbi:2-isopropylmalate synthase [Salsipaludibacter albus]|uniref:2-isopropylmalate synthase n=1 Tax=Salsipaludibacter albus TaxID=2849650 RepID=UPI001EE3F44B|nr:2-isopropylmalate synthase [Salsipaludibacter albus]MBY5162303.1 2-isopropylmalate synthase [Salsipaludibacter albus]
MGQPIDHVATDALGADITIFDTTLRDGEQSPGISLDAREKVEIAEQLARLNVDVIEAGFSAASPGDFDAVKAVAEVVGNATRDAESDDESERTPPVIAALARAKESDIEAAAKSLAPARRHRIHTFLSTSDIHRKYMLKATNDEILDQAIRAVELARSYTDDVEFSPQDATRTDFEFLVDIVAAAVEAGATTVNIPDTVGYALPHDFGRWIKQLHERIPAIEANDVVVSVHCHNDLGLAVANSLEAVRNGARQVEVAVNGIGERAGNCSLEEVVMAIRTRKDLLGADHRVNTPELTRTSRMVSSLTGYGVQKNKAVVGANAFAHESGIHQHGVLADRLTYEIMKSEDVGVDGSQIVLGKHSGRHAFRKAVDELGFDLTDEQFQDAFVRFKDVADAKGGLVDTDEVRAIIVSQSTTTADDALVLESFEVVTGSDEPPRATVRVRLAETGEVSEGTGTGDGPVNAACEAVRAAVGIEGVTLTGFNVSAVGSGIEAVGEVAVTVQVSDGGTFTGRAATTDIVGASIQAYVDALNRSQRITHRSEEFRP